MAYDFELGRIDLTLWKDVAGVRSPAVGVALNVYFKSVMVSSAGPINIAGGGGTATFNVYTTAPLAVGDQVFVNAATAVLLTVSALPSSTSVTLLNNNVDAVVITQYARLVISNRRPTVWRDERGTTSLSSSFGPTDSVGYAFCYSSQQSVDIVASGGDLTAPKLLADQHATGGGWVINPEDWGIRSDGGAYDWGPLMNHLALLAAGVIVGCPPGTFVSTNKIVVPARVIVRGSGIGATTFAGTHASDPLFEFAGTDAGLERATCTRFSGATGFMAEVLAAADRTFFRDLSLNQGGRGIAVRGADDVLIDGLHITGSNFRGAVLVTDNGAGTPAKNAIVRNLRGTHSVPAGTLTNVILIEKGALNTIVDGLAVGPSDPATQGGPILTVQTGAGADPEGVTVRGGRVSSGYAAAAINILAGLVNIEDLTVVDSSIGYLVGTCLEATLARCRGIGMRQQTFGITAGTGTVRIIDPDSSDCSQAADGASDHINIAAGREDVHISGRGILGNHIRKTTVWGRDGVHIDTGGTAITRFSCHGVDGYYGAQRGIRGDLLGIPESVLDQGSGAIDISHNGDVRDAAGALTFPSGKTIDHTGYAGRALTITAGTVLPIRNVDTIILDGNTLAITSATGGYDGQMVTVYNKNATAATLADSASIQVTGAGPLSLAQDTLVVMKWLNGKLRQAAAAAGP